MARQDDARWMREALAAAQEALDAGEVPIGAVVVLEGRVIGRSGNRPMRDQDPTAHAEVVAIREAAGALGRWRLHECTLDVTLEPCAMCAGALVLARIDRVVFGAWDEKAGMAGSVEDLLRHRRLNHRPEVLAGIEADACGEILRRFFAPRRSPAADARDG